MFMCSTKLVDVLGQMSDHATNIHNLTEQVNECTRQETVETGILSFSGKLGYD